ncbi:MAG TPA: class I SAM-dependent methyltransferase [Steroidobacteraceae bacterium]
MGIESRYLDGNYLKDNPELHREDSPWKAAHIAAILKQQDIAPTSICDVGCGAGEVLAELRKHFKTERLVGYDISPQLSSFWERQKDIDFHIGDFRTQNNEKFDVLLMLDVFEHVRDPFTFLEDARRHARNFVFHIPLDLSALTVLRTNPLMHARRKVGHLHFYTKELALETLRECGYTVIDSRYTGAFAVGQANKLAALPRRLAYAINKDMGVRLLGGETLLVLAS